jgi:hypothetical protein
MTQGVCVKCLDENRLAERQVTIRRAQKFLMSRNYGGITPR